ncbi:hypothetical protein ACPPVT_05745 [Angustibacter sp. McL0619]|uniref:hypothetical protein n=1 Tax=Angustibacter sp. McL0619 TaxID=3415676 RepID=UPI003CEB3145
MATLVTVRWHTRPPSSVDERLVITDDGQAQLAVLRPREPRDTVGLFAGPVDEAEVRELSAAGSQVELDVELPDPQVAAVGAVAAAVARRLLDSPLAAARFVARPVAAADAGSVTLALGVVGLGSQPVEFELDLDGCAVHFGASGSPVTWTPLPELATGFSTVDAEGLGGVRRRAVVAPGVLGAISLDLTVPDGADQVSVQVAGAWFFSEYAQPEGFEVRTRSTSLEPAG